MAHHHASTAGPAPLAARDAPRRRNEWRVVPLLLPYLWEYRYRVGFALAFLVIAKLANVGVPLVLKNVVDALDPKTALVAMPLALLAAYGIGSTKDEKLVQTRDFKPVTLTGVTFSTDFDFDAKKVVSHNIVGVLPGTKHPGERIIYTAHWDHLGVGRRDRTQEKSDEKARYTSCVSH